MMSKPQESLRLGYRSSEFLIAISGLVLGFVLVLFGHNEVAQKAGEGCMTLAIGAYVGQRAVIKASATLSERRKLVDEK